MDVEKCERVSLPFQFFRHCETFFRNFFSPKGPPSIFDVLQQWMLKMRKGPPFSAPGARASEHLRASSIVWIFREFDTLFVSLIL